MNKWENIDEDTDRLKVPGGWIVRSWVMRSVHQVFISDPGHTWTLENNK